MLQRYRSTVPLSHLLYPMWRGVPAVAVCRSCVGLTNDMTVGIVGLACPLYGRCCPRQCLGKERAPWCARSLRCGEARAQQAVQAYRGAPRAQLSSNQHLEAPPQSAAVLRGRCSDRLDGVAVVLVSEPPHASSDETREHVRPEVRACCCCCGVPPDGGDGVDWCSICPHARTRRNGARGGLTYRTKCKMAT